jgi:hypothetical protein
VIGTDRPTEKAARSALAWLTRGLLLYDHTGKQKIDEMLRLFDYARARYGCDQFVIDSLMRLGVAGDDYNTQEAVIFRIVEWAMKSSVHVHLVAHAKKKTPCTPIECSTASMVIGVSRRRATIRARMRSTKPVRSWCTSFATA